MLPLASSTSFVSARFGAAAATSAILAFQGSAVAASARRFCSINSSNNNSNTATVDVKKTPDSVKYFMLKHQLDSVKGKLGGDISSCSKTRQQLDALWSQSRGCADLYTLSLFYPNHDLKHTNHSTRVKQLCDKFNVDTNSTQIHCANCGKSCEEHLSTSEQTKLKQEIRQLEKQIQGEVSAFERKENFKKVVVNSGKACFYAGYYSCLWMGMFINGLIAFGICFCIYECISEYFWPSPPKAPSAPLKPWMEIQEEEWQIKYEKKARQARNKRIRNVLISFTLLAVLIFWFYAHGVPLFLGSLVPTAIVL